MRLIGKLKQGEFVGVVALGLLGLLFIYPGILISFSLSYIFLFGVHSVFRVKGGGKRIMKCELVFFFFPIGSNRPLDSNSLKGTE